MSWVISPVRLARGQRAYPFIFRRRLLRRSGVVRQVVFSRTIFFNMSPLYSMMTTEPIYSTADGCGGSFKKEIYGEVGCCESCTDGSNLLSLPLSICISLYLYLCQKVCQGPQKQKLEQKTEKVSGPILAMWTLERSCAWIFVHPSFSQVWEQSSYSFAIPWCLGI